MKRLLTIVAAAAIGLLATAAPAAADPVSALTTVFTALGASAGAASLLASVSSVALSIGLNYAAQALFPHATPAAPPFAVKLQMQTGGVVPRSFLVGEGAMTPGSLIYHGATAAGGNTPSAFYVREIALADLPIVALTGCIANGAVVTYDPEAAPAADAFGIPIPEYNKNGVDHLWVTFSDGTQTTPDPFLRAWFGDDPDYPYTADMIGRGIAKVRIVARVSQELFPSNPEFKWICDGIPLYDLRADTTAGGDGDQRWDNQATWELRSDPATVIYNVTRGITYAGEWFYGGQNLPAALLPFASAAAAANECDADMPLAGGGNEKQFRVAGEIPVSTRPVEAIETLLRCCNGRMAEIGGIYKYVVGGPGAPVLAFSDDDIIVTEEQEFDPFPDLDGTINAIRARYPEPSDGYELRDAPPLYNTSLETEDGGRRLAAPVSYEFVQSPTIVQRLMQHALAEARRFRRHNQVMPPSCYELEPLDVVSFTSWRNGYDEKSFRIDAVTDGDNCDQAWAITEVDPADADWDPETDERPTSTGVLVVQRPAVQPITGWAASGVMVTHDNGQRTAGAKLEWNPEVDDVVGVRIQIRLQATTALVLDATTSAFEAGEALLSQNLASITEYQARGKYLPRSARDTEWSDWLDFTTPDARLTEAELSTKVQAWLHQLDTTREAALATVLDELQVRVNALGQTTAGLVALLQERIDGSIVDYIGEANAAITEVRTVAGGLADLFTSVFVGDEVKSANALLRMTAGAGPGGTGVSIKLTARALVNELFKEAGLEIYAYADADGGDSGWILTGAKGLIRTPGGLELDPLLLVTQDEPRDAAITVEGSDTVIRANLSDRQARHITLLTAAAEVRAPLGITSMDYTHLLEQDGTGSRAVTFSDEFVPPKPVLSGNSLLPGAINVITNRVLSRNPIEIAAKLDHVYSRTPIFSYRDHVAAANTGSFDFSALDIVPGNLIIILAYGAMQNTNGAFGTWVYVADSVLTDWEALASFGTGNQTNNLFSDRIGAFWKIADGNETGVSPFQYLANAGNIFVANYHALAFDLLGGVLRADGSPAANINAGAMSQTIHSGDHDPPALAFSFAARINTTPDQSFGETPDQNFTDGSGSQAHTRVKTKLFTSSPADVTTGQTGGALLSGALYLD